MAHIDERLHECFPELIGADEVRHCSTICLPCAMPSVVCLCHQRTRGNSATAHQRINSPSAQQLPEAFVPSPQVVGTLTEAAAADLGLGTDVIVGPGALACIHDSNKTNTRHADQCEALHRMLAHLPPHQGPAAPRHRSALTWEKSVGRRRRRQRGQRTGIGRRRRRRVGRVPGHQRCECHNLPIRPNINSGIAGLRYSACHCLHSLVLPACLLQLRPLLQ